MSHTSLVEVERGAEVGVLRGWQLSGVERNSQVPSGRWDLLACAHLDTSGMGLLCLECGPQPVVGAEDRYAVVGAAPMAIGTQIAMRPGN